MYDSEERIITYTGTPTNSKIGLGIEEVGLGNKIYSNTIIYGYWKADKYRTQWFGREKYSKR